MVDAPHTLQSSLADRYRIERKIGARGMATVYLARDLRHARVVALKVMRPDVAAAMGVERFQREVTLTAALQHPHILSLFDSGESAGYLYYVTPYVDGESLREKLEREGQLRIENVLEITRQGQRDRALAVLERFARPRHLHFQLHLRREFTLDSLRHEPRFKALLRTDTTPRLR